MMKIFVRNPSKFKSHIN